MLLQTQTRIHQLKQGSSNNVKLTPYKIIKVRHWSVILEQREENVTLFFFFFPVALLSWHEQPRRHSSISNGGREQQCVALCCKLATWFSLQQFTFRGTQWITSEPCQNNWNANQIPRGDFGPLGSSNLPSLVIFVEWDIDFGSTFCKYLPHGSQKGLSVKTEKESYYTCIYTLEVRVWFGHAHVQF